MELVRQSTNLWSAQGYLFQINASWVVCMLLPAQGRDSEGLRSQHIHCQGSCHSPEASRGTADEPTVVRFQASQEGVAAALTHAVFHHHEATLVTLKALAFKATRRVDTDATATEVRGDPALIDVCPRFQKKKKEEEEKRKTQNEIRER